MYQTMFSKRTAPLPAEEGKGRVGEGVAESRAVKPLRIRRGAENEVRFLTLLSNRLSLWSTLKNRYIHNRINLSR